MLVAGLPADRPGLAAPVEPTELAPVPAELPVTALLRSPDKGALVELPLDELEVVELGVPTLFPAPPAKAPVLLPAEAPPSVLEPAPAAPTLFAEAPVLPCDEPGLDELELIEPVAPALLPAPVAELPAPPCDEPALGELEPTLATPELLPAPAAEGLGLPPNEPVPGWAPPEKLVSPMLRAGRLPALTLGVAAWDGVPATGVAESVWVAVPLDPLTSPGPPVFAGTKLGTPAPVPPSTVTGRAGPQDILK